MKTYKNMNDLEKIRLLGFIGSLFLWWCLIFFLLTICNVSPDPNIFQLRITTTALMFIFGVGGIIFKEKAVVSKIQYDLSHIESRL